MPASSMPQGPSYGPSPIYKLCVNSEKEDEPRSSVWTTLLSQLGFIAWHVFNLEPDGRRYGTIRSGFSHSFSSDNLKKHLALLVLLFLPVASALDNEVGPSRSHGSASRAFAWISLYSLVRILIGWVIALIIMIGGHLGGVAKTLTGPLMGFTSVLWMTMCNDSAVRPEYPWIVFGAWSVLALTYLCMHSIRVEYEKLYLLVTLAFAGVCICVLAFVQRSPTQGGLVTTVPPCVSFAAYAVAFFFPNRRNPRHRRVGNVEDDCGL